MLISKLDKRNLRQIRNQFEENTSYIHLSVLALVSHKSSYNDENTNKTTTLIEPKRQYFKQDKKGKKNEINIKT